MTGILLPGRYRTQPQRAGAIDRRTPLTDGLVSALVFDTPTPTLDRATGKKYTVTNAVVVQDRPGRVLYFDGTGDYVNTGAQTIGGVNLFADSSSKWSAVVCGRLETSSSSATFLAKCGATGANRTFHIYRDLGFATKDPAIFMRGTENVLDWDFNGAEWHQYTVTWNGVTAMAYGDYSKSSVLSVGTAAQEAENIMFGARTASAPAFLLTGRIAYGYFFNRAISRADHIALYDNPWQVFAAPARKIMSNIVTLPGGFKPSWARNSNAIITGAIR